VCVRSFVEENFGEADLARRSENTKPRSSLTGSVSFGWGGRRSAGDIDNVCVPCETSASPPTEHDNLLTDSVRGPDDSTMP
jgi:hypothetical protein